MRLKESRYASLYAAKGTMHTHHIWPHLWLCYSVNAVKEGSVVHLYVSRNTEAEVVPWHLISHKLCLAWQGVCFDPHGNLSSPASHFSFILNIQPHLHLRKTHLLLPIINFHHCRSPSHGFVFGLQTEVNTEHKYNVF